MVFKKINKKGELTLGYALISIVLFIGFFATLFMWLGDRLDRSGVTIDEKYKDVYSKINESQNDLEDMKAELKEKSNNIAEADQGWQVAWNGLLGLGTALKVPFMLVTTGEKTLQAMDSNLDIIPDWIMSLATLGIILLIILILLAIWKGDQKIIG